VPVRSLRLERVLSHRLFIYHEFVTNDLNMCQRWFQAVIDNLES